MERQKCARTFVWGDAAVAAGVAVLALLLLVLPLVRRTGDATSFRVRTDAGVTRYSLSVPCEISVTSGDYCLTLTVRDGAVAVTHADCPGGQCVASGYVSHPGESIVCLPAHVVIEITGEEAPDADWILP